MGSPFQRIDDVVLTKCCKDALKEIADKQELGRLLRALTAASPFITMIGNGPIDQAYTVLSTDWEVVSKATRSVGTIVRVASKKVAEFEAFDHRKDAKLFKFWRQVALCYS